MSVYPPIPNHVIAPWDAATCGAYIDEDNRGREIFCAAEPEARCLQCAIPMCRSCWQRWEGRCDDCTIFRCEDEE